MWIQIKNNNIKKFENLKDALSMTTVITFLSLLSAQNKNIKIKYRLLQLIAGALFTSQCLYYSLPGRWVIGELVWFS